MTKIKNYSFRNYHIYGLNNQKNCKLHPLKYQIKYKMIFKINIKDSEILIKDYKKSNQIENNYYKKLHVIKQQMHSSDKVYIKDKANNII